MSKAKYLIRLDKNNVNDYGLFLDDNIPTHYNYEDMTTIIDELLNIHLINTEVRCYHYSRDEVLSIVHTVAQLLGRKEINSIEELWNTNFE